MSETGHGTGISAFNGHNNIEFVHDLLRYIEPMLIIVQEQWQAGNHASCIVQYEQPAGWRGNATNSKLPQSTI